MKNIFKYSSLNALGTAAYITLIALFFANAQNIFGAEDQKTFLIPLFMLTMLVVSAAVTGALVLGRPIMWYLNNQKKEAIILFFLTLAWLVIIAILAAVLILLK